jgi:hypothetical protein
MDALRSKMAYGFSDTLVSAVIILARYVNATMLPDMVSNNTRFKRLKDPAKAESLRQEKRGEGDIAIIARGTEFARYQSSPFDLFFDRARHT